MSENENIYIGYAEKTGRVIIIVLSILSVLVNSIFILNFIMKLLKNTKNRLSSIEKLMLGLSIDEILISIFWFISATFVQNSELIKINDNLCKIISNFEIFFYMFDWLLICCTINQVKEVILIPLDSILKSKYNLIFYYLICLIIALIFTIISFTLNLYGKSPMITCFFSINKNEYTHIKIFTILLCSVPILDIFISIYYIIIILKSPQLNYDMESKQFVKNYFIYIGIYLLSTLLIFILYFLDFFYNVIESPFLRWFFYISTILICSTPLIIGIIRLIQTKSYKYLLKKIINNKNHIENELNESLYNIEEFNNFEKSSLIKFLKNIYISISYCIFINKLKEKIDVKNFIINQEKCLTTNNYLITKELIKNEVFYLNEVNENIETSCVEFAPKIFDYLRQLDGITDKIIQSLLPSNNLEGLKSFKSIHQSEGKGGSFFISTDDKQFLLKTINYQELELIRNLLLEKISIHFSNNENSLIGRIYGLYKISIKTGVFADTEIYLILMKNIFGVMNENLMCKYDLKGSEFKREIEINDNKDIENGVMKDLNFLEFEKVILLNKKNSIKLNNIIKSDASFLCECGIMDYSLLVCKIGLNNDEIISIFGKKHNIESDNEIKLIQENISNESFDGNYLINIDDNKGNYNENNLNFKIDEIKYIKKYIFPSLKASNLYIIAIIDFLQIYNFQKYLENHYKKIKSDEKLISSIPPEPYKERFIKFVETITDQTKILN